MSLYMEYSARTNQPHILDEDGMRDVLANFFVAGRDTTSCLLTHSFAKSSPAERALVARELAPFKSHLSFDQSKQLVYANAFVNEALRMAPPVGDDFRLCKEDCALPSGMRMTRGDRAFLCNVAIGRDPKLWSDPDRFVPERWIRVDAGGAPVPVRRVVRLRRDASDAASDAASDGGGALTRAGRVRPPRLHGAAAPVPRQGHGAVRGDGAFGVEGRGRRAAAN